MLHLSFKNPAKFPNLEQVKAAQRATGGSIVLYQNVWSAIAISMRQPRLVLVRPHESRVLVGLRESRRTLLVGWWSLSGCFWTGQALAHNLSGGLDITFLCVPELLVHSPAEEARFRAQLETEESRIRKRGWIAGPLGFCALAAFVYWYLVCVMPWLDHLAQAIAKG